MTAGAQSMPRRSPARLLGIAVATILVVVAVIAVILLINSGSGDSSTASAAHAGGGAHPAVKYGGIPKWLPKTKAPDNRVVTATAAKPALAIQGDAVSVQLARGEVLATAVGPEVPEEGEFPVPATSPCAFVVTFTKASGSVPIDPRAFTVTDDEGHLHHPSVSAMGGGPVPARVPAGRTISIKVHGVLPTGNGALNWAPGPGKPIVSWDFDVEID